MNKIDWNDLGKFVALLITFVSTLVALGVGIVIKQHLDPLWGVFPLLAISAGFSYTRIAKEAVKAAVLMLIINAFLIIVMKLTDSDLALWILVIPGILGIGFCFAISSAQSEE
ncbi:hypothetical protein C5B42_05555 [Candidatus Cerribacteria bacterium 'Amazon FNV 2010 28 9']|uniref:Uncharacterized protein n=1 Tax=Candidatus Cerribacteria bacterium 'Amazon FNV 2010 28 9' TaxID=2081795 RepID=A0A317JSC1_9BACT|nr:MAG: hypothetical protein C5B42_05555 [Candidatus Cerribacteria bacterium 'Amazon FNV 2010 28 9']